MTSQGAQRPPSPAEHPYLVPRQCDCQAWFLVPYWMDRNECDTCWIEMMEKK